MVSSIEGIVFPQIFFLGFQALKVVDDTLEPNRVEFLHAAVHDR